MPWEPNYPDISFLLQGIYQRVGILLPQFMNAPKTCAMAGRFSYCFPPTYPGNYQTLH